MTTITKVDSRYGAPMGRPVLTPKPNSACQSIAAPASRVHLRRVRIDCQGYDSGGAYWGIGMPLYEAYADNGYQDYFRAATRDAAKAIVRQVAPLATFY